MVDIELLSRYIILRLLQKGNTINPAKLRRILYYLQAWYMVYFNSPGKSIFSDVPESWSSGPGYSRLVDLFPTLGDRDQFSLKELSLPDLDLPGKELSCIVRSVYKELGKTLSLRQFDFIEECITMFGCMGTDDLVLSTLSEEPWTETRKGISPFEKGRNLSLEKMFEYYGGKRKKKV